MLNLVVVLFDIFFYSTAPIEIYTLSLHDALPILNSSFLRIPSFLAHSLIVRVNAARKPVRCVPPSCVLMLFTKESVLSLRSEEHTSESSHPSSSYAVFCLKKYTLPIERSTGSSAT